MNALVNYIQTHENWREELSNAPFHLSIKDDGPYTIFSYNQIKSDFKLPEVQVARGIILKIDEGWSEKEEFEVLERTLCDVKVVCWPFNKFFNYGEGLAHQIDWASARVQEKVDGSIIKVWYDGPECWHISTNGMINAFTCDLQLPSANAKNFGELFMLAWSNSPYGNGDLIDAFGGREKYTFIFELTSPFNRVVVPYPDTKIRLIGIRNNETGEEIDPDSFGYHFERPKSYDLTVNNIFIAAQALPYDEEGYVVVDKNWARVKIKSPAYVAAHHLKDNGNVSKSRVLDLVKAGEQDEFISYFPEYKEIFDEVATAYRNYLRAIKDVIEWTNERKLSGKTKKEFALEVMSSWLKPSLRSYAFAQWDGKDIQAMIEKIDYDHL